MYKMDINSFLILDNLEIEARLKEPIVNKKSIERLLRCKSIANHPLHWNKQNYTEKRRSSKSKTKCTYRKRYIDNTTEEVICKSSLYKQDLNNLWCSIYVSTEESVPQMSESDKFHDLDIISAERYRAKVGNYYIDVVISNFKVPYRIEVETVNASLFTLEDMSKVIYDVCKVLENSPVMFTFYDWKVVMHIVKQNYGPFCIEKNSYQKPHTITYNDLMVIKKDCTKWASTPKVDGTRCFVIIIGQRMFETNIAREVKYHGTIQWNIDGITILDCEYLEQKYYVFDIPVYDNCYIGNDSDRLFKLESLNLPDNFIIKPYHKFDCFDDLIRLYEYYKENYTLDGIIFANYPSQYIYPVLKWKMMNTVDLEIREEDNALYTSDNQKVEKEWERPYAIKNKFMSPTKDNDSYCCDDKIWEFGYINNKLIPIKPRPDRLYPNSSDVVNKTLSSTISSNLFTGIGCYMMRKYHNKVKENLILNANDKDSILLDIGTGQGGDISKWKRVSKVYCVEPSETAINDLIKRLANEKNEDISKKVQILKGKLSEVNLSDITDSKIDIITAFFCMNMFEKDDWDMLKTIIREKCSQNCRLLVITLSNPRESKNECYTISVYNQHKYKISIHDTRILNIIETPVTKDFLVNMMDNMVLVKEQKLDEDDFMTPRERSLSAMYTSYVFKKKLKKR